MKCFYSKNKKSIWLFVIVFTFLLFYDFFLIALIEDLTKVKSFQEVFQLYSLHPLLPLSRIINSLFQCQQFDNVGVKELLLAFTFIIEGLSIFEIIFLIVLVYLLYQFLAHQDHINTLTTGLVATHLIVFLVHITYSLVRIMDCFVRVNSTVYETMMDVRFVTIITLAIYAFLLVLSLIIFYFIYRKKI